MNNTLGIYFGPLIISIVETKGKQLINHAGISQLAVSGSESQEEKVPEKVKLVSLIKDELKRKKIEAQEATISLSGKDLIIRSFEIPVLPREELDSAVNFEVRKYIPFKVEELISDFQYKLDKSIKKNRVLFVGVKKDIVDKYLYILKELGLKVNAIEYSPFSVLRMIKLSEVRERGIIANISIDLVENDEVNFVVLENEFPLFCRDITLLSEPKESAKSEEVQSGTAFEKLKREIRISLDYYDRMFPLKSISKVFFIMGRDYRLDLEAFIKEMGLGSQFVNYEKFVTRYIGKPLSFSLPFIKGYCSSLAKVNTAVRINLLLAKEKSLKKISPQPTAKTILTARLKLYFLFPTVGLLVCVVTFLFGVYRILPLQKDLVNVVSMQPSVSTVSKENSYDELSATYSNYKSRLQTVSDIIKQQVYFSEQLDVIARFLPQDMWLTELTFQKRENQPELILRGIVYLGDSDKELEMVNTFLLRLKESPVFAKYFRGIEITSIDRGQIEKTNITNFIISCRR